MSKHIQPISHCPPHERIKTFLIKDTEAEGNAVFTRLETVPKNDVTAGVTTGEC